MRDNGVRLRGHPERLARRRSENGAVCASGAECGSSHCVDSRCCDTPCGGGALDCQACSATAGAAVDGTCGPLSAAVASTIVCRTATGACDVAERCAPGTTSCPADALAPAGTVCRASTGACDVAETCGGTGVSCPADAMRADGTSCADGLACNGDELCAAGACAPGTALACDDGDVCTADACADPGGARAYRSPAAASTTPSARTTAIHARARAAIPSRTPA